jgi:aspartate/methionine/tyrosine aminotransferase
MAILSRARSAARMDLLQGEGAIETFARAQALERSGRPIIHLEIGEPDCDTPAHIVAAGVEALHAGHTHYTPAPGILELRAAIAAEVAATRGLPVAAENVVVAPGAKPIVFFTLLALLDPGDEVILPDPGYPAYSSVAAFAGARVVPLPLYEDRGFRFDPADLRAAVTPRTRLIILNSPQNPTGGVLTEEDFAVVAEVAAAHDLWVLTDEVYRHLIYAGEFHSPVALPGMAERTILLDGFSKSYAMTGWRLGYAVAPLDVAELITRLIINSTSCTAAFTQRAGIAALRGPQEPVAALAASFRRRRDLVVAGLNAVPGWRCAAPAGAFYAFPNITATGLSSQQMADHLLETANVAVLPGHGFGARGEGYLRLSYANSEANLRAALARIAAAMQWL